MIDYVLLFWLIVEALSCAGIVYIVYLLIKGETEKNKLKGKEHSTAEKEPMRECPHFFGYLAEHTRAQPIPNECFGCTRAIECINRNVKEKIAEVEPALQQ